MHQEANPHLEVEYPAWLEVVTVAQRVIARNDECLRQMGYDPETLAPLSAPSPTPPDTRA